MRIVILSDTHGLHRDVKVPDGDILIHCGDFCGHGTTYEVRRFCEWMAPLPHRHKIATPGNHDIATDAACKHRGGTEEKARDCRRLFREAGIHLLIDSSVAVRVGEEALLIHGSPYQPDFYDWAWQLPRSLLAEKWRLIPDATDILVTHGPPFGKGDLAPIGGRVGCEALLERVLQVRPRLHCFGHIHEGHGMGRLWVDDAGREGWWCNAAVLDGQYRMAHKPTVVDIEAGEVAA